MLRKQNEIKVFEVVMVDSTGAEKTGLVTPTIRIRKNGGAYSTLTEGVDYSWTEISAADMPGLYSILPLTTGMTNTVGECVIFVEASGAEITKRSFFVRASVTDDLATAASLTADTATLAADIAAIPAAIVGALGPFATFTAGGDTVAPIILNVQSLTRTKVRVTFSEPVLMDASAAGALNLGNYSISGGIVVSSVAQASTSAVDLGTSAMTPGDPYNLTVTNVEDLDGNPIL